MKKAFLILLAVLILLTGCMPPSAPADTTGASAGEPAPNVTVPGVLDTSDLFTDRDLQGSYDADSSVQIQLERTSASCSSNAVQIDGSTVTITDEGTYILTGNLDDGMVIVNADKTDKVQLVLSGVSIHSSTCAPVYVLQANKVFLTLVQDSQNTLSNGGSFAAIDDSNIDAAVFSKEDLTINGTGSLSVESPAGHGIVSKDELVITGGTCTITAASHGITGKDNVCIDGGVLDIAAGKDGIHAENDEDAALGFVYIKSGSFTIVSAGDGISSASAMQIDGGSFDLLCGGGSVNGEQHISDNWGNMGGGGRPGGMGGGMPGGMGGRSADSLTSITDDGDSSASIKGLKAAQITINGGDFVIDAADDAVHSNGSLYATSGSFSIKTGDDGFHADDALVITDGTIDITESYEGLEGLSIDLNGGDITIISDDDGLNAAGGTDQSGFGGNRGDMFGSSASSDSYIRITGGTLFMNASGDGIDSNGSLTISGGHITLTGPTNGDTAVLDFETTGTISGGTFIGTGATMMAQTLTSTTRQGVIAVQAGNQAFPAGTEVVLTDAAGRTVISYTPNLSFAFIVLSSPDIIKGESYTITAGSASGTFEAN